MKMQLKEFWTEYEYKIVLTIGFLFISAISFEFGYIQGGSAKTKPIIIEKPSQEPQIGPESEINATMDKNTTSEQKTPSKSNLDLPKDCAFVGSKNSNKFHTSTCHFAKLIKPENIICFKSAEDALSQNKVGDKGCIK